MDPEYNALGLKDIKLFATRIMLTETTEEALVAMENDLGYAARLIGSVFPDVVAYACTSGSFIKGPEWDKKIMDTITEKAHCPACTTSFSVLEALKEMKITKLTMLTPYTDYINTKEAAYIERQGIKVVAERGLQIIDSEVLHSQTAESIKKHIREIDVPESDGVFISCTDYKGMAVAEELEQELGKPVLASNTTTLWWILRQLKYPENIKGYGKLLSEHVVK
mgnify:CR=1 FL=1